jgi:5'-methylthioadenosine phosphorylase
MEGPQFSTRAESELYRSWGADIIGMTNLQEAKLAREAEICFATLALATDYDCWKQDAHEVAIEAVLAVIAANVAMAKQVVHDVVPTLPSAPGCACGRALENAIITDRAKIPARIKRDLAPIIGRYVPQED